MRIILATLLSFVLALTTAPSAAAAQSIIPHADGVHPPIMINNDALYADSVNVTLQLHMENATEMLISNGNRFICAQWQPYQEEVDWTIGGNEGTQHVFVVFRNLHGTSPTFEETIFYRSPVTVNRYTYIEEHFSEHSCDTSATEKTDNNETSENDTPGADTSSSVQKTLPDGIAAGDYLRASTGAVYYIGPDYKRHLYPTEREWDSWNKGPWAIKDVEDTILAQISLGSNMQIRPGTYLVKIATDPKTYAVGANGQLRWITSEEVASGIYGADWSSRVIDLPVTTFADYTVGEPITGETLPDHTIVRTSDGTAYKARHGQLFELSEDAYTFNDYQDRFVVTRDSLFLPVATDMITGWEYDSLPHGTF